jgi:hypothetical protein
MDGTDWNILQPYVISYFILFFCRVEFDKSEFTVFFKKELSDLQGDLFLL